MIVETTTSRMISMTVLGGGPAGACSNAVMRWLARPISEENANRTNTIAATMTTRLSGTSCSRERRMKRVMM